MSESILSTERQCYVCGSVYPLHRHHVFFGEGNRDLSEAWGCWVYLCPQHHTMSNYSAHLNRQLDLDLKRACQTKLEENGWTRERFIRTFGKNYIEDEKWIKLRSI